MSEDRISLLPDSLLHHILSSLDTKQVVQTCVLSKRWKTVWTCIPTLNFYLRDDPFNESIEDSELKLRFSRLVLRVLSKHCGSNIKRLSYSTRNIVEEDHKYLVEFFISYAACHMVPELEIYTDNDFYIDWIHCLTACKSLNSLKLNSMYADEWGLLMLPRLRVLEIEIFCSDHSVECTEKMFSGCSNLESLVLVDFTCEGCATICAPKLENFEYRYTPGLYPDFPDLDKVNISGYYYRDLVIESSQEFEQFLRVFHNARSITLPFDATQALLSVSANLWFDNLRHLELRVSEYLFCTKINLPINELRCLLKCPTLKTVVIYVNGD